MNPHNHTCHTATHTSHPSRYPFRRYEAFHIFKIFVANPRKEPLVLELLQRNRDRLVTFLAGFLTHREAQDEHFHDEKAFLIEELRLM